MGRRSGGEGSSMKKGASVAPRAETRHWQMGRVIFFMILKDYQWVLATRPLVCQVGRNFRCQSLARSRSSGLFRSTPGDLLQRSSCNCSNDSLVARVPSEEPRTTRNGRLRRAED